MFHFVSGQAKNVKIRLSNQVSHSYYFLCLSNPSSGALAAFPTASGVNPMISTQTMSYYLAYNFIRPRLQQLCGLCNQQQQSSQNASTAAAAASAVVRPNL